MSLALFHITNNIEVIFDGQNQPWFKRADLGRYLSLKDIKATYRDVATKARNSITLRGASAALLQRNQNYTDLFYSLDGAIEVAMRSSKPMSSGLVRWLDKKGLEKKQKEHQLAIEGKDSALALLNDDLDTTQRQLVVSEQTNIELHEQLQELHHRAVPYLEDSKKDNGMVIIKKNNGDEYLYVAICGQQSYVAQKIRNKMIDYPNAEIVVLAETPNAIVFYNWLRERRCIEVNPLRVRHFRLGENYTHQRLLEIEQV